MTIAATPAASANRHTAASSIGRRDIGFDATLPRGWTVVDMKADLERVFALEEE